MTCCCSSSSTVLFFTVGDSSFPFSSTVSASDCTRNHSGEIQVQTLTVWGHIPMPLCSVLSLLPALLLATFLGLLLQSVYCCDWRHTHMLKGWFPHILLFSVSRVICKYLVCWSDKYVCKYSSMAQLPAAMLRHSSQMTGIYLLWLRLKLSLLFFYLWMWWVCYCC